MKTLAWDVVLVVFSGSFLVCVGALLGMMVSMR